MRGGRVAAAVWIAATVVAIGGLACLYYLYSPQVQRPWAEAPSIDAPVVVIGSSLISFALPPRGGGTESILGDGRRHLRLGFSAVHEPEALNVLERAINSGTARVVLLEISPFLRDFEYERAKYRGADAQENFLVYGARKLLQRAFDVRIAVKIAIVETLGNTDAPARGLEEPVYAQVSAAELRARLREMYPLTLREPRKLARLRALLRDADARGVEVVMIAPPRAELARRHMGDVAFEAIVRHERDWSAKLGRPLFAPGPVWPDELFVDQAHLNHAGHERFVRELREWWGQHRLQRPSQLNPGLPSASPARTEAGR